MINIIDTVIVTYGNRWQLLKENLNNIIKIPQIINIVIVDNGATYSVKKKVDIEFSHSNIRVFENKTNSGSAGGFKKGIIEALRLPSDYILLLDDDTYIEPEAISKLNKDIISKNLDLSNAAFCFNRNSWIKNEILAFEDIKNSFFEFNLLNKFKKKRFALAQEKFQNKLYVPYAGYLFRKKHMDIVDLPREDYFLYVDDTRFTYGFSMSGISIYCYLESEIYELEKSWAQEKKMPFFKAIFYVEEKNLFRSTYNIRNRANFEKNNLVTSPVVYTLNKVVYLSYVFIKYMPKNSDGINRFRRIISLLKKGYNNCLGEITD